MNVKTNQFTVKDRIISFVWQHLLLVLSLFVMTLGVALCVRSDFGSSVISTIPFVMTLAGSDGYVPTLTIGQYTYIMNFVLVGLQILVLRRRFEPVQLFQLLIGFVFGYLLDVNMWLTDGIAPASLAGKAVAQLAGCTVLAIGMSLEVRLGHNAGRRYAGRYMHGVRASVRQGKDHSGHLACSHRMPAYVCIFRPLALAGSGSRHIVCHDICWRGSAFFRSLHGVV